MAHLNQATFLQYQTTTCIFCGIEICLPERYNAQRLRDHAAFYCPNGHGQAYLGESVETTLRKQLEAETKKREWAEQGRKHSEEAEEKAQRRAAAYKGQLARVRNGVCPCCNRTFNNLQRHMTTKHPDHGAGGSR